jgi:AraC-like DNA-binding protein
MFADLVQLRFPYPARASASPLAFWRETIQQRFALDCRIHEESVFQAQARSWDIGSVKLVKMAFNGHLVMSERGMQPRLDSQHVFLKLLVGGRVTLEQGRNRSSTGPGALVAIDPARDFNAAFLDCREIVQFVVPRSELKARGLVAEFDTRVVSSLANPDTAAVWRFLLATAENVENTSDTLRARLAGQIMEWADCLLSAAEPGNPGRTAVVNRARVKDYILRRLEDPTLDTREIAAATQLSTRSINRLFEAEETTLMRYLWNCRLARAHVMLQQAPLSRISIETVAWRCGFSDAAHFSRSFKRRYGRSPREFRNTVASGAIPRP